MFEEETKLGKTLESYHKISVILNSFPTDQKISIKDLATKAGVHWNTARKALLFFKMCKPVVPDFHMESESKFRIVRKPNAMIAIEGLYESLEMRIIVKLMLKNALSEEKALLAEEFLNSEEQKVIQELTLRGYVNSIEGRFYLSQRGQSLASIGMRKLVESGVALPWEKPIKSDKPKQIREKLDSQSQGYLWTSNYPSKNQGYLHDLGKIWEVKRLYEPYVTSEESESWKIDYAINRPVQVYHRTMEREEI